MFKKYITVSSLLILSIVSWGRDDYYPHLKNKEL